MDENVPWHSVTLLRRSGVDVSVVRSGLDDESVMAQAAAERRILVTLDRDFGELAFSQGVPPPPGVVLLRFRSLRPETCAKALLVLLRNPAVELEGRFTAIREAGHRQRPLRNRGSESAQWKPRNRPMPTETIVRTVWPPCASSSSPSSKLSAS